MSETFQYIEVLPARTGGVSAGLMNQFGVSMTFARGEEIYAQEEETAFIYQVVSGMVRTTRLTSDGRRQIGAFYQPGDVFGFEKADEHRFCAEALSDAVILVAKRKGLTLAVGEQAYEHFIATVALTELKRSEDHLLLLGRKNACERVAGFLLDIADRQPGADVALPMGRQDMADYLGLTIETVSRMVTRLQSEDILHFPSFRQFRVRNRGALERLAE